MRKIIYILLFFALIISCTKNDPKPPIPDGVSSSSNPIFYVIGTNGFDSFEIAAGKKGVSMYTSFDTSVFIIDDSVYRFIGTIGTSDKPYGIHNLSIKFYDINKYSPGYIPDINKVIKKDTINWANSFNSSTNKNQGKVLITYNDLRGNTYFSSNAYQYWWNKFVISEISDYIPNSKGQKTKKIKAHFSAKLYDWHQNSINLENVEAVFIVAFPN